MTLRIGGDTARGHQHRKHEVNSTEVTADRHDLAVLARTCTGKQRTTHTQPRLSFTTEQYDIRAVTTHLIKTTSRYARLVETTGRHRSPHVFAKLRNRDAARGHPSLGHIPLRPPQGVPHSALPALRKRRTAQGTSIWSTRPWTGGGMASALSIPPDHQFHTHHHHQSHAQT